MYLANTLYALLSSDFQDSPLSGPSLFPLSSSESYMGWPSPFRPFPFNAYGMVMPSVAFSDSLPHEDPLELIFHKLSELENYKYVRYAGGCPFTQGPAVSAQMLVLAL